MGDCGAAVVALTQASRSLHGPAVAGFEAAFAERIGVPYAYSFSSGRVGLYGILRALGIGEGDEVLLQAPTHIVVANAIRYVGARPVYVDCTLDTFEMQLDDAEAKIGPRTRALLLQHTFGIPGDLGRALEICRRRGLALIEDCVHALGARYAGRPVGSFGSAAFFSTEETKTISTTMGGVAVTGDPEIATKLQSFQLACSWPPRGLVARYITKLVVYHALTEPHLHYYVRRAYEAAGGPQPLPEPTSPEEQRGGRPPGYERRLDPAQAVVGLRQLHRLDRNLEHRRAVAAVCAERLSLHGFTTPKLPPEREPAYLRFPVLVADRTAALRRAAPHGVLGTWFTSVLEEAASPQDGDYRAGSCPSAEAAAGHLVNLPTHCRTRIADIEAIIAAIASVGPWTGAAESEAAAGV